VPSAGRLSGIAVSAVHNCLYAGGHQSTQLHRVGLASASNKVWYVPKWPAGLSIAPAEEIMCCCVNKAVIAVLCPLTGNRMYTMALYDEPVYIPECEHTFCLRCIGRSWKHQYRRTGLPESRQFRDGRADLPKSRIMEKLLGINMKCSCIYLFSCALL